MVSRSGIARHHKGDGCRNEVGMSAVRGQLGRPYGGLDALFLMCISIEMLAMIPFYRQREHRASLLCFPITHIPNNLTAAHLATSIPMALAGVPLTHLGRIPKGGIHLLLTCFPYRFPLSCTPWVFSGPGHPVHLQLFLPAHGEQSLLIQHHLFGLPMPSIAHASTCRPSLVSVS